MCNGKLNKKGLTYAKGDVTASKLVREKRDLPVQREMPPFKHKLAETDLCWDKNELSLRLMRKDSALCYILEKAKKRNRPVCPVVISLK